MFCPTDAKVGSSQMPGAFGEKLFNHRHSGKVGGGMNLQNGVLGQ